MPSYYKTAPKFSGFTCAVGCKGPSSPKWELLPKEGLSKTSVYLTMPYFLPVTHQPCHVTPVSLGEQWETCIIQEIFHLVNYTKMINCGVFFTLAPMCAFSDNVWEKVHQVVNHSKCQRLITNALSLLIISAKHHLIRWTPKSSTILFLVPQYIDNNVLTCAMQIHVELNSYWNKFQIKHFHT